MFVPLLHGGGTRIKILEGLASGCTIVSTSKGAEGLMQESNGICVEDSPEDFAARMIAIVENKTDLTKHTQLGKRFLLAHCNLDTRRNTLDFQLNGEKT